MNKVSSWDKFQLLLWKNWTLQWGKKFQLLLEIVLPAIFTLLLVLIRTLVIPEAKPMQIYTPLSIDSLESFNYFFKNDISTLLSFAKISTKPSSLAGEMISRLEAPNYTIAFTPPNPILEQIVSNAAYKLYLKYESIANEAELEKIVTERNYFAGIVFDARLSTLNDTENFKKLEYTLRFPSELRTSKFKFQLTWFTKRLFPKIDLSGPRNSDSNDGGIPVGYVREGFLPLQAALSTAYLKIVSNESNLPVVELQRYPYPEYIFDPLLEGIKNLMPLILLISFIYPSSLITKSVTLEKEKQLKEVMKIMGLDNWLHWLAWFVKSFLMLALSVALVTLFLKVRWDGKVAVLTLCDSSVLFAFLLVYSIALICFCFMLAPLFSKASTAAAMTGIVMFVAFVPYSFLAANESTLTLGQMLGSCLLANTGLAFGLELITSYEGTADGMQWKYLFTPVTVDDSLTLGAIMLVMLAACVIYMLICLYVEQIYPGAYGVPQKWNFPFKRKFWCRRSDFIEIQDITVNEVDESRNNPNAFEAEPANKPVGIQVRSLKKKFGDKTVVKGISMNMYEDEITVLLGHNGAGKTTTISMLTGMFPPTAGTAIINGSDIRTNVNGARMSLGICPQHNVLFDDMSVSDHLRFFSRLKGLKGQAVEKEVAKYLRMIELENKANVASSKLSGGMKRKLSLCCALTGDTKVVLCDEPSSGLDPAARRQLWDLLQTEKVGRTVLLTTHFMDEADVLGDRIAIMCDGELKCHGTSFFLKKKFGSGYRLICVKRESCNSKEVTALLSKHVPNIEPESEIGAELTYQLSDEYSHLFEQMFMDLEENSQYLNLNGYGISITSMEEVFMKVGSENAGDGTRKSQNTVMNGHIDYGDDDIESVQSDHAFTENTPLVKGRNLFLNQWQAMFLKKILSTWRKKFIFCVEIFLPIFFVSVTIMVGRTLGGFNALPAMTMGINQYPKFVTVLETNSSVEPDSLEAHIAMEYQKIATSYGPDKQFETTGDESFTNYILNLGKTLQARVNSRYLAAATINKGRITAWLNNQPFHTAPLTVNLVHNAMARALIGSDAEIVIKNHPLPFTTKAQINQLNTGNNMGTQLATNISLCMAFVTPFYIIFLIKERESRAKLLQFVGGVRVWTFWLTQLLWDWLTLTFISSIFIITLASFQEEGFATFEELSRLFLLLFLFSFAALPLTYLVSLMFTEPATGYARISLAKTFLGTAIFLVILVMGSPFFELKDTADGLQWFFRFFPHYSLALGINKLYAYSKTVQICQMIPRFVRCRIIPQCCTIKGYFAWKEPGVLKEIVYLVGSGIGFLLLIVLIEFNVFGKIVSFIKMKISGVKPPMEQDDIDDDVKAERLRIQEMPQDEIDEQNLVLDRVSKFYNKFLAVNQLSLCVKRAESFGLLGVNGAGKTSTFKMMTGDESITFGTAYVKGKNISNEMNTVYKDIGYCPQFDALLEDLTGREVLKIFSLIRGVRKSCINRISVELAKSFGFMKHIDKPTKKYSGGNKRKLSAAIAVLGNPSVIYLDEPTTGIDPAARRQLWNVMCRIRDSGKSIVLTTHSMEECEALCTRLAVMVNGEFKCIGSTQHLKNKFSKGLILKIKVKRDENLVQQSKNVFDLKDDELSVPTQLLNKDIVTVKNFVNAEFKEAILQEEYQDILTFYIPLASIKWSRIFGVMESNRDQLNIEDYSISQTTLEEIFLEFAKLQREDPRSLNEDGRTCFCFPRPQHFIMPNGIEITNI